MADYYPVLSRAIAGLDQNTAETRRAVYERARTAIVKQLRSYDPPLSESDITRERLGLEDAIRRVETEQRSAANPAARSSDPVESVRQAAADAERLGPAATAAQSRAAADQADLDGYPAQTEQPRVEPRFSPEASPPAARPTPAEERERRPMADAPAEEAEPVERRRGPAVFAIVAVLILAGLGIAAYTMRDRLTGDGTETAVLTGVPGKDTERAPAGEETTDEGEDEAVPPPGDAQPTPDAEPSATTAPATDAPPTAAQQEPTPPAVAPVAQRSVLYEESPDQQSGTAVSGSAVWRLEDIPNGGDGQEPQVRAEIDMPNRGIKMVMLIRRNTDATLPASHTVDMQFTLAPGFPNGGIANVPGILFKAGEDAGGTALHGISVKVMNGFFLIGLSNAPNDKEQNLKLMRESSWIDLPLLYENGRRAVLSLELGSPGQQAFAQAIEAWSKIDAAQPAAAQDAGTAAPPPPAP
ncbi:hypothetical protein GCM10007276_15790 [Agaricicola taiwanensis]|uniref:Uncharacterized protein n=1 Tax=Agaricicola taiwanensis TaxID=591372 RepID=A0A8J2VSN4_9RHOB|nr:hypothetical protein [Agaricicola taiwanensis]GGE39317.1 hypothetical protein GCM10007276_15790 [Agaricicola taiwanensis]